jgi:3-oxoadipate enol-lactonase
LRKCFRYTKILLVMGASANPPAVRAEHDVDRYFNADGARLRYRDEGRGPAVLLVHGWTLDLEMWGPQVAELSDAFRVVRLDRRGFGLSSGRPSIASDAADIDSLCKHLDIERVALVGMSQGVRAVMGFALGSPQKVSCLVLDGPPDDERRSSPANGDVPLDHYRDLVRTQGIGAFRREWARHPLISLRTRDPRMREILDAMLLRYPGNDLAEPTRTDDSPATGDIQTSADGPTPSSLMGFVDAPMLIITGDQDLPSRTLAANYLAKQSSRAERAMIPAAGHLSNLDNPKAYNAVLRAFLERCAAPSI